MIINNYHHYLTHSKECLLMISPAWFKLCCQRRLLRVPWTTCMEIKPVKLMEINSEYSLQGLILKLKLQYFGHLTGRADSLEKTLMLGGTESKRRRGWQRMRWLDSITIQWTWIWALQEIVDRGAWHAIVHGVTKSHTWLSDWTTVKLNSQNLALLPSLLSGHFHWDPNNFFCVIADKTSIKMDYWG